MFNNFNHVLSIVEVKSCTKHYQNNAGSKAYNITNHIYAKTILEYYCKYRINF